MQTIYKGLLIYPMMKLIALKRYLIAGLYLMIVNNYKGITIPNDSLNLAHPIVVAQAKPQVKDQSKFLYPSD